MQLQLRNDPLNEDAALLKRYAVGGCPDGPKLRIGEGDHVTMVSAVPAMSTDHYYCARLAAGARPLVSFLRRAVSDSGQSKGASAAIKIGR